MKINLKNKWIILGIIVAVILIIVILIALLSSDEDEQVINKPIPTVVNIIDSENKKIKYSQYNNGDFSMKIPEGWSVETVQGANYAIRVYNPENELYQIYAFYTLGGFLKSNEAKQYYEVYSSISNTGFEKLAVLNPGTPDNLYKIWTTVIGYVKTNIQGFANFNFPFFFNFKVKEQFELNSKLKEELGTKVTEGLLCAEFTDDSAKNKAEGLFSVSIVDLNNNDKNLPYAVYNAVGITAPKEEFLNYEEILNECLLSIKFSDKYITSINGGISATENTKININSELERISQSFETSWKNRETTDDIAYQKELDNSLNYERIYNVNTKEVYRVQKGWYNNYTGSEYLKVTDEYYLKPISGTIY